MTTTTLITVAPTGAESVKADVPALPVTLNELVTTARECEGLGATVIHVHIRDDDARPTLDLGRLRDTVTALRDQTDLIVQLSTGGAVTDPEADRLRVMDAAPVILASLSAVGHLRVGMEDTITYAKGQPVESNMQLVARAVSFAHLAQRPPATPDQARELLGMKPRG